MFAAILRASSFVSNFAADRRPGSFSKDVSELLAVSVAYDEEGRGMVQSDEGRE